MLNYAPQQTPANEYDRIFELERVNGYPSVDEFEGRMGFALERARLESAARVLSCPFKAAAPNWQHGRVIYAAYRNYLAQGKNRQVHMVDIGTAKGFSALCALWAGLDAHEAGQVYGLSVTSTDVLPPSARVRRNTIAEVESLRTLDEILEPFPEATRIGFMEWTGARLLSAIYDRINLAFVDGKHNYEAVSEEARMLAERQQPGDLVIFDDCQMLPVGKAVKKVAATCYDLTYLELGSVNRTYAIGVRK